MGLYEEEQQLRRRKIEEERARRDKAELDKGLKNISKFLRLLFTKQQTTFGKILRVVTWILTIFCISALLLAIFFPK
jgi:hypothetical protein